MTEDNILISAIFLLSVVGIVWPWVGSWLTVNFYRSYTRKDKEPKPFPSLFSLTSAHAIFFAGILTLLLWQSGPDSPPDRVGVLTEMYGMYGVGWIIVGFILVYGTLVTACEWFMRKLIRHFEPNIQFKRWLFLK